MVRGEDQTDGLKIVDYRVCVGSGPNDLAAEVVQLLQAGWELYGQPVVSIAHSVAVWPGSAEVWRCYIQAMVKRGLPKVTDKI